MIKSKITLGAMAFFTLAINSSSLHANDFKTPYGPIIGEDHIRSHANYRKFVQKFLDVYTNTPKEERSALVMRKISKKKLTTAKFKVKRETLFDDFSVEEGSKGVNILEIVIGANDPTMLGIFLEGVDPKNRKASKLVHQAMNPLYPRVGKKINITQSVRVLECLHKAGFDFGFVHRGFYPYSGGSQGDSIAPGRNERRDFLKRIGAPITNQPPVDR